MKEEENAEHPTSNTEHRSVQYGAVGDADARVEEKVYDLEERLLEYSAAIIRLVRELPKYREANHVAAQLLRSGTAGDATLAPAGPTRPAHHPANNSSPHSRRDRRTHSHFRREYSHCRKALDQPRRHRPMIVRRSMFDVGCSMFAFVFRA